MEIKRADPLRHVMPGPRRGNRQRRSPCPAANDTDLGHERDRERRDGPLAHGLQPVAPGLGELALAGVDLGVVRVLSQSRDQLVVACLERLIAGLGAHVRTPEAGARA